MQRRHVSRRSRRSSKPNADEVDPSPRVRFSTTVAVREFDEDEPPRWRGTDTLGRLSDRESRVMLSNEVDLRADLWAAQFDVDDLIVIMGNGGIPRTRWTLRIVGVDAIAKVLFMRDCVTARRIESTYADMCQLVTQGFTVRYQRPPVVVAEPTPRIDHSWDLL